MLGLLGISASGIQDANLRLHAAAHNVASINVAPTTTVNVVTSEARAGGQGVQTFVQTQESVFGVDLVSEALNTQLAVHSFKANANAAKAANEVTGTLLNMMDTDESER